jgi:hypothetical protein
MVAAAQGRHSRAAKLLGAAQAFREDIQSTRLPLEQVEFEQTLAQLTEAMDEAERDAAMTEGQLMGMDNAIAFARET